VSLLSFIGTPSGLVPRNPQSQRRRDCGPPLNATIGFEALAVVTDTPSKSLHRMLSQNGNPSMDNLAAIFDAVRHKLKVGIRVRTVAAA